MTAKRDNEPEPKSDKRPKLKKETLRDLEPKNQEVRGGAVMSATCGTSEGPAACR